MIDTPNSLQSEPITKDISFAAYQKICRDIRYQPKWRLESDKDADYYDGAQISHAVAVKLRDAGIPEQDSNLIKPTINAVLGIEARSRTDYKITSDDEQQDEIAEAMSAMIKEMETESRADRAMSDAYSSMIRTGVGWVEVSREYDPLKYPYRVREVHRNDIFWDWTAREPDLSDARYLRRDKWLDRQSAIAMFPKETQLIENAWSGWNTIDVYQENDTRMCRAYEDDQNWSHMDEDYLNRSSGMVKLSELWYRYWEFAPVLMLPNGKAVEYDPENALHVIAVARGAVQVQKSLLPRVRVAIWLGPHKLMDEPTPLPHGNFPYVPFWCFRKDRSRTPYGLIRDMRGPQNQIIDLDILLYEVLNSKRVEVDNDALDLSQNTYQEVAQNIASPRSMTILNAQRRNADGFRVTVDNALAAQVYQLVQERQTRIESVSGVYRAMLGNSSDGKSGVAISNLVEQGSTVLAEPNDNFRYARRLVGEMLTSFIKNDLLGKPTQVSVQRGARKQVIFLNREVMTPQGKVVQNDIAEAQVKVVLEDIPATPSFRAQQFQAFSQVMQFAPPAYQAVLYPALVELSDMPNRHAIAEQLRKVGNVPDLISTPEQEAAAQQQAQMQQQIQMKGIQLELALKEAQVAKLQAEAAKVGMDAQAEQQNITLQAQIETLKAQVAQTEMAMKNKELDLQAIKIRSDAVVAAEKVSIAERAQALDEKTAAAVLANPAAQATNQTRS